jgi:hypothetical protein
MSETFRPFSCRIPGPLEFLPRLVRALRVKELSKFDFDHMQIVRSHMKPIGMCGIRLSRPKLFMSTDWSFCCLLRTCCLPVKPFVLFPVRP